MKPRNQVDDEKSMKERKVKGEKVVQVAQSVSCAECARGRCSNTSICKKEYVLTLKFSHFYHRTGTTATTSSKRSKIFRTRTYYHHQHHHHIM